MTLTVLCPTRTRPVAAGKTYESFRSSKTLEDTELLFIVDDDDPTLKHYQERKLPLIVVKNRIGWMVDALNQGFEHCERRTAKPVIYGFVGDDNRFESAGWDMHIAGAINDGATVVYCNDRIRSDLPTSWFVDARIPRELGWFGPPNQKHLFMDNAWKQIGLNLGGYKWLEQVYIPHLHPSGEVVDWTPDYLRVNSDERFREDGQALQDWIDGSFPDDMERVRERLGIV